MSEAISIIETEATNLKSYWGMRNAIILADRDRMNLVKTATPKGTFRWYDNEPKVFFDTSCSLVSAYPPRFRLPMTINFSPEEKQKMNKVERFLLGIYRTLDDRQMDIGESYWLRTLAWYLLQGWWSVFSRVEKVNGEVKFLADIFDPLTVYPQWDANGLIRCIRMYEVDKITAIAMASDIISRSRSKLLFTEPTGDADVSIVNYWRNDRGKIYNAILISGQVVKNITFQKNFDRIPIHIGSVGQPDRVTPMWSERRGENIIAPNRDMYDYTNQLMSLRAEITAATAYPNLLSKSRTGQPVVKAEDVKGHGGVIPMKEGETLELLRHAATPEDVDVLLSFVGQQKQKGSIPNVVYGGVPFELSGFAISQLMAAIRYNLGPYLTSMQYVLSRIMTDLLYQYKKGNFGEITLSTTNPSDIKRGMFYMEEFTKEDVPEVIFVEATIPITSQFDKTQKILNAKQALSPPQLLSRETLWEDELDVQDSEQEYTRIIQDQINDMPVVKTIAMIEQLREKENLLRSQGKIPQANALAQYILMLEASVGMTPETPTAAPSVPPELSPPEARESPDQKRAALGKAPPSPTRTPKTAQEKAESRGRRGILVSPTGQALM